MCVNVPLDASGSSTYTTSDFVFSGGELSTSSGITSVPSHVWSTGMRVPSVNERDVTVIDRARPTPGA